LRGHPATALDETSGIGEQALDLLEVLPLDQRLPLRLADDLTAVDALAGDGGVLEHLADGVGIPAAGTLGPRLLRCRLPSILQPHRYRVHGLTSQHITGGIADDLPGVGVGFLA